MVEMEGKGVVCIAGVLLGCLNACGREGKAVVEVVPLSEVRKRVDSIEIRRRTMIERLVR